MKNKDLTLSRDNFDLDDLFFKDLEKNFSRDGFQQVKSFSSFISYENGIKKNEEQQGFFFSNNQGEGFVKTFKSKNGQVLTTEKKFSNKKNKIENK